MMYEGAGITLSQYYNSDTLNIFCDASIISRSGKYTGCYGAVAVCKDEIIDSCFKQVSETTNNNAEIKAIRAAISIANKFKSRYRFINIFSDSQISIFGLRDYIYKWKYNPNDGLFYGSAGTPIANQSIFIECHNLIMEYFALYSDCTLSYYHQSGHVDNGYNNLREASIVFSKSNKILGSIDLNFIRYISTYNNYVDSTSRSLLRRANLSETYTDPIEFIAQGKINRY